MGGPSRKVGANKKKQQNFNKQHIRKKFLARHVDQVWEDVRKPAAEVHQPGKFGPQGTTARGELDEDTPGYGKHYCIACARYFQDAGSLLDHEKTKGHKRTVKMLMNTARPHNQKDAETAAGLGAPDNGRKLRSSSGTAMMDT